jgi:hypothetical protein
VRRLCLGLVLLSGCFGAAPPDGKYFCTNNTQCLAGNLCYETYCCKQDRATGLCVDHPCLQNGADLDRDGFPLCAGDCNDDDPAIYPGAPEICDTKDNDCDSTVDEGVGFLRYRDLDRDGHGSSDPSAAIFVCQDGEGLSKLKDDCDDADGRRFGGNPEVCDQVDNDCNSEVDNGVSGTWYKDVDGDGYGRNDSPLLACTKPVGYGSLKDDCDDASAFVHPGATELCNGVDDDCDSMQDEDVKVDVYPDADGDGFGALGSAPTKQCTAAVGQALNALDCDDTAKSVNPAAGELCNGIDDNCNGSKDEGVKITYYADRDNDSYGNPAEVNVTCPSLLPATPKYVQVAGDCADNNGLQNPAVQEICNGAAPIDDDCDGVIDEGLTVTYFEDLDADGYGNAAKPKVVCGAVPAGHVQNALDCADTQADTWPGAPEACDGRDNNCDGANDNSAMCGPRTDQAEVAALWGAGFNTTANPNQPPPSCLALSANATSMPVAEDPVNKVTAAGNQASVKTTDTSAKDFFLFYPQQKNGAWNLSSQRLRFDIAVTTGGLDSFRSPLVLFCSNDVRFASYQPPTQPVLGTGFAAQTLVLPPVTASPPAGWFFSPNFAWSNVNWVEVHLNSAAGSTTVWLDDFRFPTPP